MSRVVHSALESKFWKQVLPAPEEVRPAQCPGCQAAAREPGRPLAIVGHGLRDRQQRGPATATAPPSIEVVPVRRYRCLRCGAVLTVVPRDVEPRRHYSRPAIALALARLGLWGERTEAIRRAVCAWPATFDAGWSTLRGWVAAVRRGSLFPAAAPLAAATSAEVAARVAQVVLSYAPTAARGAPTIEQVFAGAVAMA